MPKARLSDIVDFANRLLKPAQFEDWPGAENGLQAENTGIVTRLAAAVDANPTIIRLAIQHQADLLLVHHGLFWSQTHPWTGHNYQLVRLLLDNNIAVYSSHLPLDAHPRLGNNIQLCQALRLGRLRPFFFEKGRPLGLQSHSKIDRLSLAERLRGAVGSDPILLPGGPAICRRIGVVTGGAGSYLQRAKDEGVDTFVTGEGPHWTFTRAEELQMNLLYGGHYATETFGVKALANTLACKFRLPWTFLDHPSGL